MPKPYARVGQVWCTDRLVRLTVTAVDGERVTVQGVAGIRFTTNITRLMADCWLIKQAGALPAPSMAATAPHTTGEDCPACDEAPRPFLPAKITTTCGPCDELARRGFAKRCPAHRSTRK